MLKELHFFMDTISETAELHGLQILQFSACFIGYGIILLFFKERLHNSMRSCLCNQTPTISEMCGLHYNVFWSYVTVGERHLKSVTAIGETILTVSHSCKTKSIVFIMKSPILAFMCK